MRNIRSPYSYFVDPTIRLKSYHVYIMYVKYQYDRTCVYSLSITDKYQIILQTLYQNIWLVRMMYPYFFNQQDIVKTYLNHFRWGMTGSSITKIPRNWKRKLACRMKEKQRETAHTKMSKIIRRAHHDPFQEVASRQSIVWWAVKSRLMANIWESWRTDSTQDLAACS